MKELYTTYNLSIEGVSGCIATTKVALSLTSESVLFIARIPHVLFVGLYYVNQSLNSPAAFYILVVSYSLVVLRF
jgi:hypothetical protein